MERYESGIYALRRSVDCFLVLFLCAMLPESLFPRFHDRSCRNRCGGGVERISTTLGVLALYDANDSLQNWIRVHSAPQFRTSNAFSDEAYVSVNRNLLPFRYDSMLSTASQRR